MILEQETFEKFGYYTSQLTKSSHKPVVRKCDTCGEIGYPRFIRVTPYCRGCGVSANSVNIAKVSSERLKRLWKENDVNFSTPHPVLSPLVKQQRADMKKANVEKSLKAPRINKICSHCGTEKPVGKFGWLDKAKGWLQSWCKMCKAAEVRRKRLTDINFKLMARLRTRLSDALRGNFKAGSFVRDLGCTIPELKQYIESQFSQGMTWENHGSNRGKWQLDHKDALCNFDLSNREEFLKAAHYTNLQPLWHEDHIQKTIKDIAKKRK